MGSFAKKMKRKNKPREQKPRKENPHASGAEILGIYSAVRDTKALIGDTIDTFFLMARLAMHRAFGFGTKRWTRLLEKMRSYVICMGYFDPQGRSYVTPEEIDQALKEEAKMVVIGNVPLPKDPVGALRMETQDNMSRCFMLALLDAFDFKGQRIHRAYDAIADIGDEMIAGRMTKNDLAKKVAELDGRKAA